MSMSSHQNHLTSSKNYIWNTQAVLGKGATGNVYQGMNKATGELVAVKAFNRLSHLRPYEVQRREFEVLKKVNHENIVKLIAIEEESDHKVLIMELCTGGSLFNILDDPANSFGLEEMEFLTVLKHLAAGMKHLHDMRIIHRDLKPGNIMKFHSEDGQSIYKLTDFGAARELEEDQQFVSLYGTEEYLHPDLYERAVLRKPASKSFNAKVDLWSIGVTLFHIATGSLPFRPYGGRKNKEMMYRITTEKESGMISGIQHSENGEIEWSKNLPRTCRLSMAFQNMVTPLLAGLLECNAEKMWTFEQFFSTVTNILSHKPIHVFYVNRVCDYTLYLQPTDNLSSLKQFSKETALVPMQNQLLICNKKDISNSNMSIGELPTTTPDNPIILLDLGQNSIEASHFNPSNQIKFPEILNSVNCEQDAQLSKACAAIAYCTQRNITKCSNYFDLIIQVPQHILTLIDTNVEYLNERRKSCHHVISSMKDQIDYTNKTTKYLSRCMSITGVNSAQTVEKEMAEIIASFEQLQLTFKKKLEESEVERISNIVSRITKEWQSDMALYASRFSGSRPRSEHFCSKIKDSWLFLHKQKSTRSLTANESELHHLEKLRIHNNCKKLKELLDNSHKSILDLVGEKLDNWYHDAKNALLKSILFSQELGPFMESSDAILKSINFLMDNQDGHWLSIVDQLSTMVANSNAQHRHNSLLVNNTAGHNINNNNGKTDTKLNQNQLVVNGATINRSDMIMTECSHGPENFGEELQALLDTQRILCASLSENQSIFSELVALTLPPKNQTDSGQY